MNLDRLSVRSQFLARAVQFLLFLYAIILLSQLRSYTSSISTISSRLVDTHSLSLSPPGSEDPMASALSLSLPPALSFETLYADFREKYDGLYKLPQQYPKLRIALGLCLDQLDTIFFEVNETLSRELGAEVVVVNATNRHRLRYDGYLRCQPSGCPSKQWTPAITSFPSASQRILHIPTLAKLQNKTVLCELAPKSAAWTNHAHIVPPCVSASDWESGRTDESLRKQFPLWLFKPAKSYLGFGISFARWNSKLPRKDGSVQAYIHNPLLHDITFKKDDVTYRSRVKVDLRVYGVVTSIRPLRFYLSEFGYYRSGDPRFNYTIDKPLSFLNDERHKWIHVSNNGPKKHLGILRRSDNFTEWGEAGTGSLHRFLTHIVPRNGLSADAVLRSIRNLHLRLFTSASDTLLPKSPSSSLSLSLPTAASYQRFFTTFSTDLVIDTDSRAWLYEIHTSCSLKPRGFPDVEAGWDPVVTWNTRQATWGSMLMGLAPVSERWMGGVARAWVAERMEKEGWRWCSHSAHSAHASNFTHSYHSSHTSHTSHSSASSGSSGSFHTSHSTKSSHSSAEKESRRTQANAGGVGTAPKSPAGVKPVRTQSNSGQSSETKPPHRKLHSNPNSANPNLATSNPTSGNPTRNSGTSNAGNSNNSGASNSGASECISGAMGRELVRAAQEAFAACKRSHVAVVPAAGWSGERDIVERMASEDVAFYRMWERFEMQKLVEAVRGSTGCTGIMV